MAWNEVVIGLWSAVGVGLLRSVGGWLNNALEDGKIEKYEVKKLLETVLRLTISGTAIYFSVPLFGFDPNIFAAAASAALIDLFFKVG